MENQLSVVICNKNSLRYLKKSIPSIKKNRIKELIVVDGHSTDGSLNYLKKQNIKTISDKGRGLSYSRGLGIKSSKGKYVLIAGPDDIFEKNFFITLIKKFKKSEFDAATILIRIKKQITYWDECLNFWFIYIRKPGPAWSIGTPTLYKKNLFKKVKYKTSPLVCDDTYISEQLIKKKFKLGVLNIATNQFNNNKFNDFYRKFYDYGKSDCDYYLLNKNKLNFFKKVNIILHPIKHFLNFFFYTITSFKFKLLPFVFILTFIRYKGLIEYLLKKSKRN